MAVSLLPVWKSVCRAVTETSRWTDRELLERFSLSGDEAAFEVVLRRHSALVLGVCRRVLGNDADADDAFQATFLVLARKAASTAWRDSVAGWLHRTAHQIAVKARCAATRRARHEKQAQARASANPLEQLSAQELLSILDEELLRLPERYRVPLVLCYLQGNTRDEAALQLGCRPATLKYWLEQGRQRLHQAARRRGLTVGAILGATVLLSGGNVVAAETVRTTMRAAAAVLAGNHLTGLVSSNVTQLIDGGLRVMVLGKSRTILALLLLCGVFTGAVLSRSSSGTEEKPTESTPGKKTPAAPPRPEQSKPAMARLSCQGRVLSPEGKPVPRAKVLFVRHFFNEHGDPGDDLAAHGLTGADGRFQLIVPPSGHHEGERATRGMLLAVAPGHGPGWLTIARPEQAREATVKLVKDDVPLVGRVVDLDGKPTAGASVRVLGLTVAQTEDLGPWLKDLRTTKAFYSREGNGPHLRLDFASAGLALTARTDREGRFRLTGFGRERLVQLRFSGPTIETRDVYALTRQEGTLVVLREKDEPRWGSHTIHGATFTHAAAPTRPVVGTVKDRGTGKPVAGITVRAVVPFVFQEGPDRYLVTRTDKEGRYRLVGLPRRQGQEVRVAPDPRLGYLPSALKTARTADLEPARLDFKLSRGIVIRGRVTDRATGQPVQARVDYLAFADNPFLKEAAGFRDSSAAAHLARRDGTFTLVGMPGRGIVTARVPQRLSSRRQELRYLVGVGADGIKGMDSDGTFATSPYLVHPSLVNTLVGVDLARDQREVTCNLVLDPGKPVKGTVVDVDGKPISGVRVRAAWGQRSAPHGPLPTAQFTLTAVDLDRPQPFFFTHREKKLGVAVMFKGDRTEGVTVKLLRLGTITGRLLDLDGEPLAGRRLVGYVEDGQLNIKRGWAGFFGASADKDGRFRAEVIAGVKVGAYFEVTPSRLGGTVFQKLTLKPGQVHDVGDVKVNARPE
jgi:RNA polymerase sigma factor (sigma-70 family)